MRDFPALVRRLSPAADPVLVAVVALLSLQPLLAGKGCAGCETPAFFAYALIAVQSLPLAFRRRWPLTVVMLCGPAAVVYGLTDLPDPPVPYGALVAVYSAAAHSTRLGAYIAAGGTAVSVIGSLVLDRSSDIWDATFLLPTFATAWLLGDGARRRRDMAAEMKDRADQLERTRTAEAAAAVAAERNRIARELHDVIAHHLSMMVVQAEAGPVVVASDPDRAAGTFDAISAAGKEALREMRRLLGVLKEGEHAPLRPQPGVESLGELVDRVRSAGIDVRMRESGQPRPLPATVDLSVYRLVQEALTNCVRHAGPSRVDVDLAYEREAVSITVTDDGAGARAERRPGGHGLVAMSERVTLVGGTLDAGPGPNSGWVVRAVLPVAGGTR